MNGPEPVRIGVNQVVGQVGLVRLMSGPLICGGSDTVCPSAIWSAGPSPATRLMREIVTGMPPTVSNSVE